MFGKKKKMQAEIVRLTYRVAELEERLCPCEQHDWKKLGFDLVGGTGRGDEETIYCYKCKRCGKQMRTWQPFLEKDGEG